jgi:hypothetical protein
VNSVVLFRPKWMADPYCDWFIDRFPSDRGVATCEGKLNFGLCTDQWTGCDGDCAFGQPTRPRMLIGPIPCFWIALPNQIQGRNRAVSCTLVGKPSNTTAKSRHLLCIATFSKDLVQDAQEREGTSRGISMDKSHCTNYSATVGRSYSDA